MKTIFLHNHPHPVHGTWAESLYSHFILDRVTSKFKIPGLSRFFKSLITLAQIPRDTDLVLCESGSQLIAGSLWKTFHKNKKLASIVSDPKIYYLKKMRGIKKHFYIWMFKKTERDVFLLLDIAGLGLVMGLAWWSAGAMMVDLGRNNLVFVWHSWWSAIALIYICLFWGLWYLEKIYRFLDWYKGKRSVSKPGLVLGTAVIMTFGIEMFKMLVGIQESANLMLWGVDLVGMAVGALIIYLRSGFGLKS